MYNNLLLPFAALNIKNKEFPHKWNGEVGNKKWKHIFL